MKTAVIIAAHNEAANIARTLESCGSLPTYVVDDDSSDDTYEIARRYTPNVLRVQRGGKGPALRALIVAFDILNRYDAFITLDGDSVLTPGAAEAFERKLSEPGVAGVVGTLHNRGRHLIACWRSIQYLQVHVMYRRGMEIVNCIHVMCGTCAIWRTELFQSLSWHHTPVEDMDWTYQLHRRKLGRVAYAPDAHVITQEPTTLRDYTRQMLRWFRGYWLTTTRYRVPLGRQRLDLGQALVILESLWSWVRLALIPVLLLLPSVRPWALLGLAADWTIVSCFAIATAVAARRPKIALLFPVFIVFLFFDIVLNLYALCTYSRLKEPTWVSPTRSETVSARDLEVAA